MPFGISEFFTNTIVPAISSVSDTVVSYASTVGESIIPAIAKTGLQLLSGAPSGTSAATKSQNAQLLADQKANFTNLAIADLSKKYSNQASREVMNRKPFMQASTKQPSNRDRREDDNLKLKESRNRMAQKAVGPKHANAIDLFLKFQQQIDRQREKQRSIV
tara:strand:- start:2514 stop:2999 length:486 start_codon:yes stop_codon:yes gene_type:complete